MSEQFPPVPVSCFRSRSGGRQKRPRHCLISPWHYFTVCLTGLVLRRADQHCRSCVGLPGHEIIRERTGNRRDYSLRRRSSADDCLCHHQPGLRPHTPADPKPDYSLHGTIISATGRYRNYKLAH